MGIGLRDTSGEWCTWLCWRPAAANSRPSAVRKHFQISMVNINAASDGLLTDINNYGVLTSHQPAWEMGMSKLSSGVCFPVCLSVYVCVFANGPALVWRNTCGYLILDPHRVRDFQIVWVAIRLPLEEGGTVK